MDRQELTRVLRCLEACPLANRWVKDNPEESPASLWWLCTNAEWMVWFLAAMHRAGVITRKTLVRAILGPFLAHPNHLTWEDDTQAVILYSWATREGYDSLPREGLPLDPCLANIYNCAHHTDPARASACAIASLAELLKMGVKSSEAAKHISSAVPWSAVIRGYRPEMVQPKKRKAGSIL